MCCLVLVARVEAQFSQLPVDHSQHAGDPRQEGMKIMAQPLLLPFWDDFSNGKIDSLKWDSKGALASFSMGIDPPSIGAVYLDGVDSRGKPYSAAVLENGDADQLVSREIDLSSFNLADSLFLSFYWQAGGRGEMPDENDQLQLYFLDDTGEWQLVWETSGGDLEKRSVFSHQFVLVEQSFFHAAFRFRFQNKGRLSGPFDTWVLDYVYLNKNRSVKSVQIEDRALTRLPTSPFGKLNAIPYWEWDKAALSGTINSQFKNLSSRFRAMEYSILLRDKESQKIIRQLHAQTPFNPVPQALERRDFSSIPLKAFEIEVAEPFDLETIIYLTTGDHFLIEDIVGGDTIYTPQVDFRINDTVYHTLPVRDFFAYDNGVVDYAAGINQRSGMLAVRYELSNLSYLKGISINFANFSQVGSPIELMVWNDLDAEPIFREEVLIPEKEQLEEFAYFPLDTNLRINNTFFIGFTQFSNDFIYIGLDKSSDAGEEIFFNVNGSWQRNEEVAGSLMMRPHLSLDPVSDHEVDSEDAGIVAYPNPVIEKLFIEGVVDDIKLFDAYGRQINIPVEYFEKGKILNFTGSDKGVYVLWVWTDNKPYSMRILVK